MQPTRRGQAWRPVAAVALLLVGIAALGVWRVLGSSEALPYRDDSDPPAASHVTRDQQYLLAVPGGVQAMLAHGVPVAGGDAGNPTINLQCTYTASGQEAQTLAVSAESTSTKATNTVGTFVAPITGKISVRCTGWGAMFVPDADDAPSDNAGLALLVSVVTLTVGACLAVAELYVLWGRRRAASADGPGDDDQVEALVDVPRPLPYEREVVDPDRDDVAE